MRLIALPLLAAVALAAGAALQPAAAQNLPPCGESRSGELVATDITDPYNDLADLNRYFATHRMIFTLKASAEGVEDPDGTRYQVADSSERLAPAPGVLGPNGYIGRSSGTKTLLVNWTVQRVRHGQPAKAFCTGSGEFVFTLAKPTRTWFGPKRLLVDRSPRSPRFLVNIAGRYSENLSPVDVRIRRGARGRRKKLFTLPLADVKVPRNAFGVRRTRFRRKFAGMTIYTRPRDANTQKRGLLSLFVKVPRARAHRAMKRSFTLEMGRGKRTLLRMRAVIRCHGLGPGGSIQLCRTPVFKVARPRG